ncbi:hypothetical protein F52700_11973 [Fusarium sp. NRRL 52700]|nr:hypothetical protein F52700_11973 [Fusarium sp. NRRL 52700]
MSSPPNDEAGLNTPLKNNGLENISPNIEVLSEVYQKTETPKVQKQEQKGPDRVALSSQGRLKHHGSTQTSPQSKPARGLRTPDAALEDPEKEMELIIEEEVRIVRSLWGEGELEHLNKIILAQALRESKREAMKKHKQHLQETKMQEPAGGVQEDAEEGHQTGDTALP